MISWPRSLNIQIRSPLRTKWIVAQRSAGHGVQALPEAVAGLRVQAAQLAVAVDAVDVVADHQRGGDDRVERVGAALVLAPARCQSFSTAGRSGSSRSISDPS